MVKAADYSAVVGPWNVIFPGIRCDQRPCKWCGSYSFHPHCLAHCCQHISSTSFLTAPFLLVCCQLPSATSFRAMITEVSFVSCMEKSFDSNSLILLDLKLYYNCGDLDLSRIQSVCWPCLLFCDIILWLIKRSRCLTLLVCCKSLRRLVSILVVNYFLSSCCRCQNIS